MLNWIESQKESMVELITKWANISSYSLHLADIAKMKEALLLEFAPVVDSVDEPLENLLYMRKNPQAKRQILLVGHMDTVYPEKTLVKRDGDKLIGQGTADMKGGLVMILTLLKALKNEDIGLSVIITPDEEIGSPRSAPFLAKIAKEFDFGLVFEPCLSDGSMVSSRPGSATFEISAIGKAAHAGRNPGDGISAIGALAELTVALLKLQDLEKGNSVNIGTFHGGQAVNVIAPYAQMGLNIRSTNNLDALIEKALSLSHLIEEKSKAKLTWKQLSYRPPKEQTVKVLSLIEKYKTVAKSLGFTASFQPAGGVTDGNNLQHAGLTTIDTLGPIGHHLHCPEEYMEISSLSAKTKIAYLLIKA